MRLDFKPGNPLLDVIKESILTRIKKKAIPWYDADSLVQEVARATNTQAYQVTNELQRLIRRSEIDIICHGNLLFLSPKENLFLVHSRFPGQIDDPFDTPPAA